MAEASKTETSKRTKLTERQLDALQAAFSDGQMPDAAKRQALADELGLTPRCVHVWFQNRRQRSRATTVPSVIYQVIDSNGRDNVHGTISSLLGFQVPPLASAKPEQQPTLQHMREASVERRRRLRREVGGGPKAKERAKASDRGLGGGGGRPQRHLRLGEGSDVEG